MAKRTDREVALASTRRAYHQRDELLIALSKVWESHLIPTKLDVAGSRQDWLWSVCLHAPCGQLVFPVNNVLAAKMGHLERDTANHWDGHTSAERSKRLASL